MNRWKYNNYDWEYDDFIDGIPQDHTADGFDPNDPFYDVIVASHSQDHTEDDDFDPLYTYKKEIEKKYFENKPRCGKFANAYSHNIDNIKIMQMRIKNCTLREIAKQFNCSPSTIRNRLNKLGMR